MMNLFIDLKHKRERAQTSFQERSAWIQLIGLLVAFGAYFYVALQLLTAGVMNLLAYAGLMVPTVVLLVAVIIAGYIAAAITGRTDGPDERDTLFEGKAEGNSGWILGVGVMCAIGGLIAGVEPAWIVNMLLFSLVLSEVTRTCLQIVSYRRSS
jgi:hypothetical protein